MTLAAAPAQATGPARIGPNAIIRVAEALRAQCGETVTAEIFRSAGLDRYLTALPQEMVDEREVIALHQRLRPALGEAPARAVAREAGLRTGDYLLAHRIPRVAQFVLRLLPPALASRVLLRAIGGHAWTFAGSGTFHAESGRTARLSIAHCPLCRGLTAPAPLCDYYAATFERLYRTLVSRRASVTETQCQATGAASCSFEITWSR